MINSVKELGPYIVLDKGIAGLQHLRRCKEIGFKCINIKRSY